MLLFKQWYIIITFCGNTKETVVIYDEVGKEVVIRQMRSSKHSQVVDVSKALHEHCLM